MIHRLLICIVLVFSLASAQALLAQSDTLRVAFSGNDVSIDRALLTLRRNYDVAVVYDSQALRGVTVSGDGSLMPFTELLGLWLDDSAFTFEVVNATVIIFPKEEALPESSQPEFGISAAGRITDADTGEALPFANVVVISNGRGATANAQGWFYLPNVPADTSTFMVSYLGFEPQRVRPIEFEKASAMTVELRKRSAVLPAAVVKASRRSEVIRVDRPSLVSIDNEWVNLLPNTGEPDPIRNLQLLPGVSGALENSANLHIRGGAADENLVVYDGITIYYLDHFYGLFSAFNANSVKNIRLHKGVFEPMHGGRAASVVEVTGKTGNRKATTAKADVGLLSASVHLETPIIGNKAALMLSARRSFTDVLYSPLFQNLFNNLYANSTAGGAPNDEGVFGEDRAPDFAFYDLTGKVSWESDAGDQFSFTLYNGSDQLAMEFTEASRDMRFMYGYNDQSRWGTTGAGARWARQWSPETDGVLTLGYSVFRSELFGFDRRSNLLLGIEETLFFDRDTELSDLTMRYDLSHQKGNHRIGMGTANTALRVENRRLDSEGESIDNIAAEAILAFYLQDEWQATGRLSITGGVRSTYYSGFDRAYHEPRLMARYKASERLSFHGGYGRTWQFIRNVRRQDLFLNTADEWRLADAEVPALRADQISAGATVKLGRFELNTEAYLRTSSGSIEDALRFIAFEPGTFANDLLVGTGNARGVELLLSKNTGIHTGWLAYTLAEARNSFDQLNNSSVPSYYDRRNELKFVYGFNPGKYRAGVVFVYGSGLPFTAANGTYLVGLPTGEQRELVAFSSLNGARLPAYHRLDVSGGRTFEWGSTRSYVGLSLYNVYNRRNLQNRFFFSGGSEGDDLLVNFSDIVFLGFVPSIRVSIEW